MKGLVTFFIFFLSFNLYADDPAKTLYEKAKELTKLADSLTGKAEKACYWGKKEGGSSCMKQFAKEYNDQYGKGSFIYVVPLNVIQYTGIHFHQLMKKFPQSSYAAAADYDLLLPLLVGQPDEVVSKVEDFLRRYPSGEWHWKGKLLLARIYQDIWALHRGGLGAVSTAGPQKYQELALRHFKDVFQNASSSAEGKAAKQEYNLLKAGKDDGKFYGISSESQLR